MRIAEKMKNGKGTVLEGVDTNTTRASRSKAGEKVGKPKNELLTARLEICSATIPLPPSDCALAEDP